MENAYVLLTNKKGGICISMDVKSRDLRMKTSYVSFPFISFL